jgi:hypothetical protein
VSGATTPYSIVHSAVTGAPTASGASELGWPSESAVTFPLTA